MTLSDLRNKVKWDCPEVIDSWPTAALTDDNIDLELNEAALEIAHLTCCIPSDNQSDPLDITADENYVTLPTNLLVIDSEGGVFFKDSDGDWQELDYKDMAWLDAHKVDWRNADSSSDGPDYCYQRGNRLYFYPALDEDRSDGIFLYYGIAPTRMTGDDDEPFDEITYLDPYHYLVALRVKIEAKGAKKKWNDRDKLLVEYTTRLAEMDAFIHGRRLREYQPDIIQKMKGYRSHYK